MSKELLSILEAKNLTLFVPVIAHSSLKNSTYIGICSMMQKSEIDFDIFP